jgi:hypothetical protein
MHDVFSREDIQPTQQPESFDLSERLSLVEAQLASIQNTLNQLQEQSAGHPYAAPEQPTALHLDSIQSQLAQLQSALNQQQNRKPGEPILVQQVHEWRGFKQFIKDVLLG